MSNIYYKLLPEESEFEILILDNAANVAKFIQRVEGDIDPKDYHEIFTQIVMTLLNDGHQEQIKLLPDFNRMRPHASLKDSAKLEMIKFATRELGNDTYNELVNIGAYKDGQLPFFFEKLIDGCFALFKLQY